MYILNTTLSTKTKLLQRKLGGAKLIVLKIVTMVKQPTHATVVVITLSRV